MISPLENLVFPPPANHFVCAPAPVVVVAFPYRLLVAPVQP